MLALACDDCQQRSRKNPVRRDAQDVVLAGALSRAGGKKFRFRHRSSGRGAAPRIAQRRHSGRLGSQTQGGGDRPKGVVDEAIRRCAPLACLLALADHTQTSVLINELHDDDATAAGDTGEGVEIVATAGESLSGYKIHLYNGSPPPPRQRRRLCHHRGAGRQPGQLRRAGAYRHRRLCQQRRAERPQRRPGAGRRQRQGGVQLPGQPFIDHPEWATSSLFTSAKPASCQLLN